MLQTATPLENMEKNFLAEVDSQSINTFNCPNYHRHSVGGASSVSGALLVE